MICRFRFGHDAIVKDEKLAISQEDYDKLRKILPEMSEDVSKLYYWSEYTADITDILDIVDKIEIIKVYRGKLDSITKLIDAVGKLEKTVADHKEFYEKYYAANFNERCLQHVPNASLFTMKELRLEQDACTDFIHDLMKEDGWRVLAICPQPNQRRPDYILGRS